MNPGQLGILTFVTIWVSRWQFREIRIRHDASTLIDVAHRFSLVSTRLISPTCVGMLAGRL